MAVTLALVGWGAFVLVGFLVRDSGRDSEDFQDVTSLQVGTGFEDVEIHGSPTATGVSVERTWTWSLVEPAVALTQEAGRVRVTSSCPGIPGPGCAGRVRVTVPESLPVVASTGDGDLRLVDLAAPFSATTSDGDLEASGLRSAEVTTTTRDGDVRLAFTRAPATVTTRSGDGDLDLLVPDDGVAYDVTASVADGEHTTSVPTDPRSAHRIEATTRDGSLHITTSR